jgi:hypothetical protein
MKIKAMVVNAEIERNDKLNKVCSKFKDLLSELRTKDLDPDIIKSINTKVEFLNSISDSPKSLINQIKKKQYTILKHVEKEAKLVAKNHYRNLWLAIGMAAFGIPLGVAFGSVVGNMAFLGIGLPIGLAIGIAIGSSMDKKAKDEGRQLDFELN